LEINEVGILDLLGTGMGCGRAVDRAAGATFSTGRMLTAFRGSFFRSNRTVV